MKKYNNSHEITQDLLLFVMPGYENNAEQLIPIIHKKKQVENCISIDLKSDIFFVKARAAPFLEAEVSTLFSKEEWKALKESAKIKCRKIYHFE